MNIHMEVGGEVGRRGRGEGRRGRGEEGERGGGYEEDLKHTSMDRTYHQQFV